MSLEIRLGVIGLGRAAAAMLPSLEAHPGIKIVAAADPFPAACARFQQDFGGKTYDSAAELCEAGGIDAVYIATPHQRHVEDALTAASFGKHMIVEKPMALTLSDCRRMIEAAASAGVIILVGHTHGFDPAIRKMREVIETGELGALKMITSIAYTDFLYRPRRPEELDSKLGGGIMYNQVPHQIEMARVLTRAPIRSVRALTGVWDQARPTEGAMSALMSFENDVATSLVYCGYDHFDSDEFHDWIGPGGRGKRPAHGAARRALIAAGSKREDQMKADSGFASRGRQSVSAAPIRQPHFGVLIASCERADLRVSPDGIIIYDDAGAREIVLPTGRAYPNRDFVADDFYDAVVNGRQPLQDGTWGMETVAAMLALVRSATEHREIILAGPNAQRDEFDAKSTRGLQ